MQVITELSSPLSLKHPVITIGTFDGVHLGHKAILEELKLQAAKIDGETVVVTFDPHPRIALGHHVYLLNTRDEKRKILEEASIFSLIEIPFTPEFSKLSAEEFIEFLSNRVKPELIIIGYDHGFGHHRKGNIDLFYRYGEKYGYQIDRVEEQVAGNSKVSSTTIRWLLQEGDVEKAASLLGYYYQVTGEVVRGNQIGKLIGFPTANLFVDDPNKLIPAMGVYASTVLVRGMEKPAMTNIGIRPTINAHKLTIETNIFDFDEDIYYEPITVKLIRRIRNEKKFASLDMLKKQLELDKEITLKILNEPELKIRMAE
ncbi:MAG: bifunctional riboflavin kinase/FAD synthetase [Bacteroidota bacterium]